MNYREELESIHALYHDDKEMFLYSLDKKGFGWYTMGEREVRVLTGQGTVIDYKVGV